MFPSVDRWRGKDLPIHPERLVLVLSAAGLMIAAPLNHDVGFYLEGARRVLTGERLYTGIIDPNPPLIFWMMTLPALAGRHLGMPDAAAVGLFASVVLVMSIAVTTNILNVTPAVPRLIGSCMIFAFLTALSAASAGSVAQREHLAAMLILPYVTLRARALQGVSPGTGNSLGAAVLGGVGLAIKPFFLLAWFMVEAAVLLFRDRSFKFLGTAVWIVIGIQCLYLVLVLLVTPEYVTNAVPLARALYGSYDVSGRVLVSNKWLSALLALGIATTIIATWRRGHREAASAALFGAATVGWLLAFFLQRKGWHYHLLPAIPYAAAAFVAAVFVSLGQVVPNISARRATHVAAVPLLTLLALGIWILPLAMGISREAVNVFRYRYPASLMRMVSLVEELAPGDPIYVLSTSVYPAFPLVNLTSAQWPYHYHCLWAIPALYAGPEDRVAYRTRSEQGLAERQFFDTVVGDLVGVPPRVLFVERGPYLQAMRGREFDFLRYFEAAPEFRALMTRYRRVGFIDQWELFELRR